MAFQSFLNFLSRLFGAMFNSAPMIAGSRWWMFLFEFLLIIVVIDLIVFGWRPLVRKFFPKAYDKTDYIFGQTVNALAFIILAAFLVYIAGELGAVWGTFLGISTIVWSVVAIIALIFLGRRFSTRRN